MSDSHRDGGTREAPTKLEHKQPILQEAQRRSNEKRISCSVKQTLTLNKPLCALEGTDTGHACDEDPHVQSGQLRCATWANGCGEDGFGKPPDDSDRNHDYPKKPCHSLRLKANKMFVAGAIGLCAESVEASC